MYVMFLICIMIAFPVWAEYTVTIDGDNATAKWERTGPKQKIIDTSDDAARNIYKHRFKIRDEKDVVIPYDDLTYKQKLAIIDKEFASHLLEQASAGNKIPAVEAKAKEKDEENKTKHGFE